jgi:hypothetical protein
LRALDFTDGRQNLTMHMRMRCFTHLTNGSSKKAENHAHAMALHYMYYTWCDIVCCVIPASGLSTDKLCRIVAVIIGAL